MKRFRVGVKSYIVCKDDFVKEKRSLLGTIKFKLRLMGEIADLERGDLPRDQFSRMLPMLDTVIGLPPLFESSHRFSLE